MLRSYEKGRQLGDQSSPWVRHEVEFRRTREKPLTTDMLRNPLEYLVGAYKPLEWIANVTPAVIDRVKIETKISYDSLVNYAKTSYGRLIHVMHQVMGDPEKVIRKLSVEGIPRRLNPSAMVAA
jgi:phage replication initiation protein